jgi:hypothetical protein
MYLGWHRNAYQSDFRALQFNCHKLKKKLYCLCVISDKNPLKKLRQESHFVTNFLQDLADFIGNKKLDSIQSLK